MAIPRMNLWINERSGVVCISLYLSPFERTRNGNEKEKSKTTILTSFHSSPGRSSSSKEQEMKASSPLFLSIAQNS